VLRLLVGLFLATFLYGCGAPSTYYNRGFSKAQTDRDYFDCQLKAGQAAGNDDYKRIMYTVQCMKHKGY
jgi:hypothetical protein